MLSIPEEILLLTLDEEKGTPVDVPAIQIDCAIAGAILMDLALQCRIDTGLNELFTVDASPTGDPLLDEVLESIVADPEEHDAAYWVQVLSHRSGDFRDRIAERLVEAKILKRVEERLLWVFGSRRYPQIDGGEEREVKRRIVNVLLDDGIPDPRDIVILTLADTCGVLDRILSTRELKNVEGRLRQLERMDLIGQAVTRTVYDIRSSIPPLVAPIM